MKKSFKIIAIIIGALILFSLIWPILRLNLGMTVPIQAPEKIYSPDRTKVIIPSINSNKDNPNTYLLVHLDIQDTLSGKTVFEVQTRASDRMRWSVDWINNNTVKLNSSDIGSYCWREEENGIWKEYPCP